MARLWRAFYIAVIWFFAVIAIGGAVQGPNADCVSCGAQIAITVWLMGIAAHQPILWSSTVTSKWRSVGIWGAAVTLGFLSYLTVEGIAAPLVLDARFGSYSLLWGQAGNIAGILVAGVTSWAFTHWSVPASPAERIWMRTVLAALLIGSAALVGFAATAPCVDPLMQRAQRRTRYTRV